MAYFYVKKAKVMSILGHEAHHYKFNLVLNDEETIENQKVIPDDREPELILETAIIAIRQIQLELREKRNSEIRQKITEGVASLRAGRTIDGESRMAQRTARLEELDRPSKDNQSLCEGPG